jgi:hypothetical protein
MGNAGQQGEEEEPEYVRARKCVEKIVPQHIKQWAAAIGQTATDELQGDVTKALFECVLAHIAAPGRWRWRTARKAYLDLAEDYDAMSKLLRHWESGRAPPPLSFDPRFKDLPSLWPEPALLRAKLAPYNSDHFKNLAKTAKSYAKACAPDEGGRPRTGFDTLCYRLKEAFERATRRQATSSGDFCRLLELVWPVACDVAETVTKRPMSSKSSTSGALRRRLQRLLVRLDENP